MGGRPGYQEEVQDAPGATARQDSDRKYQEARLEVLLAKDGALPYGPVPGMVEKPADSQMLVVPPQDATTSSRTVPTGSCSRRPCGRKCGRRAAEEKSGSRCGTSWPIRSAASRCWTSSPPRMWGGELCRRRRMQRARCLSGSSGSGEKETKRGERRLRRAPRSRNVCFSLRPPSWHPQKKRGASEDDSLCFSLVISFFTIFMGLV
jgi:hypothetical protein